MEKVILVTGATDGIGFETAKMLVEQGHHVLLHGRNPAKLADVESALANIGKVESYIADLSDLPAVAKLADEIMATQSKLDVIINNAGVYGTPNPLLSNGLDIRFVVNTIAPYALTRALLPLLGQGGRVVNLSSAAQATVNLDALNGKRRLADGEAYAQSKLALTMWSRSLGLEHKDQGKIIVSVNPKSFLGSKMVKDAYGVAGHDLSLGADILVRASLSDEFANAAGAYFDNDLEQFAQPHSDALDIAKVAKVIDAIDAYL
jgi:NAD(P)-dependent dehydrogenase (short-subunit alcohol dehydrogenase family)